MGRVKIASPFQDSSGRMERLPDPHSVATDGVRALKLPNGRVGKPLNILHLIGRPKGKIIKPFAGKGDTGQFTRGLLCVQCDDFHSGDLPNGCSSNWMPGLVSLLASQRMVYSDAPLSRRLSNWRSICPRSCSKLLL